MHKTAADADPSFGAFVFFLVIGVGAVLVAAIVSLSLLTFLLVAVLIMLTLWRGRIFSVHGYVCLLGLYYWLGLANPFHADVHGVTINQSTAAELVTLVVVGIGLLLAGACVGRRLPHQPTTSVFSGDTQGEPPAGAILARLYRGAYACLGIGVTVALACYVRFGVPALTSSPDLARTEFVGRLSPFTYYQWLFIEVGFAMAAVAVARDRRQEAQTVRVLMMATCATTLVIISGV